jgi:ligand-binding sensor domain-containing protein/signal transduction histidine kinase
MKDHSLVEKCLTISLSLVVAVGCVTARADTANGQLLRLPVIDGNDLRFAHISFGDGPSHSRVGQIVQDNLGFLWFGTQDGLQRYDGYSFKPYRPDPKNPKSISGVFINSLFKDRSGMLWVGSDDYLDRYDPAVDGFTHFSADRHDPGRIEGQVYDVTQDREGNLWLATDHGLNRLEPATGRTTRYQHNPSDSASLSADRVRSTFEDKEGRFWVATTEGVDLLDRRTGKVVRRSPLQVPGNSFMSLFEDRSGVLWVVFSVGNGLAALDRATGTLTRYSFHQRAPDSSLLAGVTAILEDEDGILWLGTLGSGLLKFDKARKAFVRYRNDPSDSDSLSENNIYSLLQDREGNVWVGTSGGGVNRFSRKPLQFRNYRHRAGNPNSLASDFVASTYQDSRGILWVGSRGALNRIDRPSNHFHFYQTAGGGPHNLSNTNVVSIAEDHSGYLWFGTWGGGLNRFDRRTGEFKVYRHEPADPHSLSDGLVGSLLIDRKGELWAGTDDGLDRFDPETQHFRVYRASQDGFSRYHAIAEDADGVLWLGSWEAGLQRFDPTSGQFTIYRHAANNSRSLSSDRVNSICIDSMGTIWVGTQNGLDRFDRANGTFTSYDERNGLPNSTVNSILEDKRGNLWLGTNNGLSRFTQKTNTFRNYYASDGLPANEFNGYGTAYKSSSGEMFFCSYAGLVTFFPDQIVDNSYIPPVVLADFRLFGDPVRVGQDSPLKQPISVASSITLSHEQNIFSLEFSALSYSSPERNRYRYRLEPLETRWNETGSNRRFASYTTLPPGQYIFRVQGSNNRGIWNETGASVRIQILPPFWNTAWFRTMAVALLLLLLGSAYYFRIQSIERQFNMRLEERVGERTRIARELHDTLLQSFQGLLLRFQSAYEELPARAEARKTLGTAIDLAAEAITEGRDAVQGMRSSTVETNDLALALKTLGEYLAADESNGRGVESFVEVQGTPRDLHPILRDEIYRIGGEAMRNAFRHARARRIEVAIGYGEREFRLGVRDNGRGIDPEILAEHGRTGHWGLAGMRERAELIGGRLEVWSELESGTEVEVTVPASIAYSSAALRSRLFSKMLFARKTGTNS